MSLLEPILRILDAKSIKTHQVSAVVGFELLYVEQECLEFADGQVGVLVDHERTVIDAGLEYLISSGLLSLWIQLVKYFNVIFYADDGFVDLLI